MTLTNSLVGDLAIIMTLAAIVVYLFYLLKQPMIIGYLIAGVIIGPYTPPFSLISSPEVFSATADLGVILLLFGIGLQFPISKLLSVGKVSLGVAAIEVAFMIGISLGISRLLGWPLIDALFLGTALASSSTAIIAKVLADMGKMQDTPALIMLGILVVEDLIVVGLLALITSNISSGAIQVSNIAWILLKIVAFVVGSLLLGILIVPRVINRMAKAGNTEVLLLIVLGLTFGLSIAGSLLGFSVAIGAFLMGVIVASSAQSVEHISNLIAPIRDMFAAIFFVSVGALIDVTQIWAFLLPALAITGLMIFGKMVGCGVGTRVFGYDLSTSVKVGLGMSQIGEFAFIVMKAGQDLNLISPHLFSIVGVAAGITTFLTPYLIKLSYKIKFTREETAEGSDA